MAQARALCFRPVKTGPAEAGPYTRARACALDRLNADAAAPIFRLSHARTVLKALTDRSPHYEDRTRQACVVLLPFAPCIPTRTAAAEMVHRTYYGLGPPDAAVREFEALAPHAAELLCLRLECQPFGPDYMAIGIALDGLETAAYHFTRRRNFYHALESAERGPRAANNRLADRQEAVAAFKALAPYAERLRALMFRCRPFGRDYLALDIARQSLETAAFHFTRIEAFYGSKSDSAGPVRPVR